MPRKSPFNVNLSGEERQTLESMARKYTSPYCDVIRAKIILLANEGLSNDVIASRLDTPRQIVSKWRKRFAFARSPGLEEQPRGGRKARFSPVSSFRLRLTPIIAFPDYTSFRKLTVIGYRRSRRVFTEPGGIHNQGTWLQLVKDCVVVGLFRRKDVVYSPPEIAIVAHTLHFIRAR